jgi:ribosome-associated protein
LTEGLTQGRWAVLDYTDCVIHVFHPAMRQFYQLERLWGDATPVSLDAGSHRPEPSGVAKAARRAAR